MKKLIKLPFINTLAENLRHPERLIQVILGPRQVGKTTTVQWFLDHEYQGEYQYVSADKIFQASFDWLLEQWQEAKREKKLLVIDEIQKVENWAEVIKKLWDEDRRDQKSQLRVILLGSSSLDLQKGLSESLAGRFQLTLARHWNFQESKEGYGLTLEQFIKYGGYPGSYPFIHDEDQWVSFIKNSILTPVIEKDILLNHTVKSPALFKQAFDILRAYPAQEVSYRKLLGQLQDKGNTDVIKYYLRLYEGAFLFKSLEKFSSSQMKTRSSSPKIFPSCPAFYYLDILDDYKADERGRVFEILVGNELLRIGHELYYWREGKHEVDFILKKGRNVWAIEVKSGKRTSSGGLDHFLKKFPKAKGVIVTPENLLNLTELLKL